MVVIVMAMGLTFTAVYVLNMVILYTSKPLIQYIPLTFHCAVRPCGDYYCFNEGTCETNTSSGMEYCQCGPGYTGEYCLFANDSKPPVQWDSPPC